MKKNAATYTNGATPKARSCPLTIHTKGIETRARVRETALRQRTLRKKTMRFSGVMSCLVASHAMSSSENVVPTNVFLKRGLKIKKSVNADMKIKATRAGNIFSKYMPVPRATAMRSHPQRSTVLHNVLKGFLSIPVRFLRFIATLPYLIQDTIHFPNCPLTL